MKARFVQRAVSCLLIAAIAAVSSGCTQHFLRPPLSKAASSGSSLGFSGLKASQRRSRLGPLNTGFINTGPLSNWGQARQSSHRKALSHRLLKPRFFSAGQASSPLVSLSEEKSETIGVLLAIFPGILVHGLGHYYAGNDERFRDLLQEEGLGLLFLSLGAGLLFLGFSENDTSRDKDGAEKTYRQVSSIISFVGGSVSGLLGTFLFLGSWVKDIYDTPAAVRNANAGLAWEDESDLDMWDDDWGDGWDEDFDDDE